MNVITKDCDWSKCSIFKRRIHGFLCYQMQSIIALINPVLADVVMFKTLSEQFEEKKEGCK